MGEERFAIDQEVTCSVTVSEGNTIMTEFATRLGKRRAHRPRRRTVLEYYFEDTSSGLKKFLYPPHLGTCSAVSEETSCGSRYNINLVIKG